MPLITFILSLLFSFPQTEAPVSNKNNNIGASETETGRSNTNNNPDYIIITEMEAP